MLTNGDCCRPDQLRVALKALSELRLWSMLSVMNIGAECFSVQMPDYSEQHPSKVTVEKT